MSALTITCNAGGMPIGLVTMTDAVAQIARTYIDGVVDAYALVSDEKRVFRSAGGVEIPAPLVIATRYTGYHDVSRENNKVSRHVLFARDKYTCQYCGDVANARTAHKTLTVDHVKPAHLYPSRAEATTWQNVTSACVPCNRRKGGHLPMEVHGPDGKPMMPKTTPTKPEFVQVRFAGRLNPAQKDYVNMYFGGRGAVV